MLIDVDVYYKPSHRWITARSFYLTSSPIIRRIRRPENLTKNTDKSVRRAIIVYITNKRTQKA